MRVTAIVLVAVIGGLVQVQIDGSLDTHAPELRVGDTRWASGEAPSIEAVDAQGLREVRWRLEAREGEGLEALQQALAGLEPGAYPLEIVAEDRAWSRNRATWSAWVRVGGGPPVGRLPLGAAGQP